MSRVFLVSAASLHVRATVARSPQLADVKCTLASMQHRLRSGHLRLQRLLMLCHASVVTGRAAAVLQAVLRLYAEARGA